MSREFEATSITVAQGASVSGEITAHKDKLTGSVQIPALVNGGTLTFQGASAAGGTYASILSAGGTSAASISASSSQGATLPADVFNYGALKITMAATQAQLVTIGLFFKG